MKIIFAFLFLINTTCCFGQKCGCNARPELVDFVNCSPNRFDNGSKVYWQYNCDSSWLTFENKDNRKKILYSVIPDYCGRIGFSYAAEFNSLFLVCNRLISGCCEPPEYLLFDKKNGQERGKVGPLLFYSEDRKYPVIIAIANSFHKSPVDTSSSYDSLSIINVNSGRRYAQPLPKNRLNKTLQITHDFFPELLFGDPEVNNGTVTIPYRYRLSDTDKVWYVDKITVEMGKYP